MNVLKSFLTVTSVAAMLAAVTSCNDSIIFEDEGHCDTNIQFVFKKHRQALHSLPGHEPDAFHSTVGSVHLFVYDANTGELVLSKTDQAENLQSASQLGLGSGTEKCYMPVDLPDGQYRLVAWCGLDDNDNNNAFSLVKSNDSDGFSHCEILRSSQTGRPVNAAKYDALYHGRVETAEINTARDGSVVIPIELTKNTNDIAVCVQHTSVVFDKDEYEVVYTDANGTMKFRDNSMLRNDVLEYHPHTTSMLTASADYEGEEVQAGALIAHISTARLMKAHENDARLEVRDRDGNAVFSIPFIKFVTQMQTFTDDHQYYLDCEDTYNCMFFLTGDNSQEDPNGEAWIPYRIIINGWVKVPDQDEDI